MNKKPVTMLRIIHIIIIIILHVTIVTYSLSPSILPAKASPSKLQREIIGLYIRLVRLSEEGIDTRELVNLLSEALELLNNEDNASSIKAQKIVSKVREAVEKLEAERPSIVISKNLSKYGTAAAIASIPVLFYLLFPRIYLELWYKTRRKWVVEK
ncbi:MAG: hypothetical protein DRJ55_05900 [Thermoprotei archaeon]|nr:MAG: hypothetical protein DRJ55_05900 [Thermoprotei archaeon]